MGFSPEELEEWWNLDFTPNTIRGTSYLYYYSAAKRFCEENNIQSIIRAHEVQKVCF
jgi:hypothetical protein